MDFIKNYVLKSPIFSTSAKLLSVIFIWGFPFKMSSYGYLNKTGKLLILSKGFFFFFFATDSYSNGKEKSSMHVKL